MPTIEALRKSDVPAAAGLLARAFNDNPGMLPMFPGTSANERLRALEPCMNGFIASVLRYGVAEAVKDRDRITGVSLSLPPGGFPAPLLATLIQAKGPLLAGPRVALRFARINNDMLKRHPHYRHWYLWFLGVEPECQGQGVGSLLLRSLTSKAEADRVPCYLETDRLQNVKLYERHGYRVEADEVMPHFDFRMWFMKRPCNESSVELLRKPM